MAIEQVSTELLRGFSPLDGLKRDNLAALARKVQIRELSPGQLLFKEGDTEKRTIYVVSGILELVDQAKVVGKVEGGSELARNPVAPVYPRRVTAKARDRVQFISIDSDLLDVMLTWDQTGTYEVSELQGKSDQGNEDWMTMLLQTKAFHKIPPANIQAIFMRLQQINCKADEVIINLDDGFSAIAEVAPRFSYFKSSPTCRPLIELSSWSGCHPEADTTLHEHVQEVLAEPFPGTVAQGVVLVFAKEFSEL